MSADVIAAAAWVDSAAKEFCAAVLDLDRRLAGLRKAAYLAAGSAGASDVAATGSAERLRAEVVGVLIASGVGDLLGLKGDAVTDFAARWQGRSRLGNLETSRPTPPAPDLVVTAGQRLHRGPQ